MSLTGIGKDIFNMGDVDGDGSMEVGFGDPHHDIIRRRRNTWMSGSPELRGDCTVGVDSGRGLWLSSNSEQRHYRLRCVVTPSTAHWPCSAC